MTYERYEKLCTLLKECLSFYEQMHTKEYTFSYNIASGDNLTFKINESKIPHLLGVNTDLIKNLDLFKSKNMSSFELLNYILNDSYSFSKYLIKHHINIGSIFSPMIEEKIKAFEKNVRYGISTVVGTIKIDRSKNWQDDMPTAIDVDYLIIKEMENNYAVLGLRRREDNCYVPVSNMCWNKNDLEKYMKYLKKQECSFPTKLYIKEINKLMWVTKEEKKVKLQLLRQWANRFDMSIDISFDYDKMLSQLLSKISQKENADTILETMTSSIIKNSFPIKTDYDNFYLKKLAYAINVSYHNHDKEKLSYSKLKNELETKKEELSSLKSENQELKKLNDEKNEEIEKMRIELRAYKALFNDVKQNIISFEESQPEGTVKKRLP